MNEEVSIDELLTDSSKINNLEFEAGLEALEKLIVRLSDKSVKLADMVKLYEVGTLLSQRLFEQLREAEQQIKVFREKGDKLVEEIHEAERLIDQLKGSQPAR